MYSLCDHGWWFTLYIVWTVWFNFLFLFYWLVESLKNWNWNEFVCEAYYVFALHILDREVLRFLSELSCGIDVTSYTMVDRL